MSLHQLLELSLALLYLGLVAIIARRTRRIARAFPWLLVLMAFFVLRSAEGLFVVAGIPMSVMPMAVHAASVLLLVLLLVGSAQLVEALQSSHERSTHAAREYERALYHYTQLMRHRLANPLTAIHGGIATLQELELDATTRRQILDAMELKTRELEQVALHPELLSSEERELDPLPRLSEPRRWA